MIKSAMDQTIARTLVPIPPPVLIGGVIPLIDVAGFLAGTPGAAEKAAAELAWAFENVGFYYLAGHGVPKELIEAQYAEAARFHAQPLEEKLKIRVNEHTIGYMPIADKAPPNAAAQGKKPSQNEAFFLRRDRPADDPDVLAGRRFHVQNQWPANLPGFREQTLKYMSTMEALCRKLVRLYALALDLPADTFDACFSKPHMILRQSRYPRIDASDDQIASLVPHTDSGFMTLLPPNKVPVDQPAERRVVRRALCRGRLRGERRRHPASLDQRALPVDAAPRAQRLGHGALRHPVLLRSRPRHGDRMPAVVPVGRPSAEISADQDGRLRAVVRRAALPTYAEREDADGRASRPRRTRQQSLEELS